jgi:putative aldouronate transport system substrate-binding protein
MSKIRKILMTTMIACLALSLVACTSSSKVTTTDNKNSTKPAEEKATATAVVTANKSADDLGWKSDIAPITFDWYLNFSWFPNKWGVDPTSQYITKKTGVNINFIVPAGNENEKLNTMIASGKLPDFITLGWYEDGVKKMIEGGMVLPLNKLADEYDPYFFKVADPSKVSWYTQPDGNFYGYPNASSSPEDYKKFGDKQTSNQTFVVRKDMYEALGKPDMRTQEGFLNALKAAKEKFPDVNGQPLIPIGFHEFTDTGNYSFEAYLQNFLAIPQAKDGKFYERKNDPEYISWLKTFRKANEMGLMSKDVFIDKRPQMEEKIAQGRYFAMMYQRTDFAAQENALFAKDPNSVYIAVDGPANTKQDPPTLSGAGISGWTVTLISKDVKDKARAIRFISYMLSEEGQKDFYLGEKGVSYDNIDGKDQFKPEVLDLLNKDRSAFDKKYGSSYTFWQLMDTNMNLQWAPASVEPAKQLEDWTKGKATSFSEFDQLDPAAASEEGIAKTKIDGIFSKALPKLLLAKSDAEFDTIFAKYVKDRDAAGFDKLSVYKENAYQTNLKKLGK